MGECGWENFYWWAGTGGGEWRYTLGGWGWMDAFHGWVGVGKGIFWVGGVCGNCLWLRGGR